MRGQSTSCACGCGEATKGFGRFVAGHNPASHKTPESIADRFRLKVERLGPVGECWQWRGPTDRHGYGRFFVSKKLKPQHVFAHRFAYVLEYGGVIDGLVVCHRCDNPGCVRPDHLFLGHQRDNLADMWAKGRGRITRIYGERQHLAKLRETDIPVIRARHEAGESQRRIARAYNVDKTTIQNIVHRKTWQHVP